MSGALGELGAVFREDWCPLRGRLVMLLLDGEGSSRAAQEIKRAIDNQVAGVAHYLAPLLPEARVGVNLRLCQRPERRGQTVTQDLDLACIHLLEVRRQHEGEHVRHAFNAGRGSFFRRHVCALRPELAQLVARGPIHSDRNRKSIFTTRGEGHGARTAFAMILAALDALYRALERAGDQVAAFGARFSRGVR